MDLERLPSGKWATNAVVLLLGLNVQLNVYIILNIIETLRPGGKGKVLFCPCILSFDPL